MTPFDYITSINKKQYMDDLSGFVPWLTNKVFSVHKNYVFYANCINKLGSNRLPLRAIYDFYYYSIPKNNQWLKWPKNIKDPKVVKYIMDWFGCNESVAKDYYLLLDKSEIRDIIYFNEKLGVGK